MCARVWSSMCACVRCVWSGAVRDRAASLLGDWDPGQRIGDDQDFPNSVFHAGTTASAHRHAVVFVTGTIAAPVIMRLFSRLMMWKLWQPTGNISHFSLRSFCCPNMQLTIRVFRLLIYPYTAWSKKLSPCRIMNGSHYVVLKPANKIGLCR